ncbi:MAG: hypothetical protein Tsb0018_02470 [Opitutales bacterium]|tara:strand:- start:5008 stop:6180 length:1173 start_codon:yes stop_codon:yes gene_type:complete
MKKQIKIYTAMLSFMLLALGNIHAADQNGAKIDLIENDSENAVLRLYAPDGSAYSIEGKDTDIENADWAHIAGPIVGYDNYVIIDVEENPFEEYRIVITNLDGEVKDISKSYSWYNLASHVVDTSGKQMMGEMTPEFAQSVLPYAQMSDGANKYKATDSEVSGYKILTKEELPEELQKWMKDEKSQLLEDMKDWSSSGMRARIYQNIETGDVVLAFAGTELRPLSGSMRSSDWWRMTYNLMSSSWQAGGGTPKIYSQAAEWTELLQKHFGNDKIIVTGVSMGGGLAQYAGLLHEVPVYAFNSVGLGGGTKSTLREHYSTQDLLDFAALDLVTHVNVEGESLSEGWLLTYTIERDQLGKIYTVPCYSNKLYGPQRHDISVVVKSLEKEAGK